MKDAYTNKKLIMSVLFNGKISQFLDGRAFMFIGPTIPFNLRNFPDITADLKSISK